MNLTEKSVQKITAKPERQHIYDSEVTGFGLRIEPNGRKSFFWFAKVNGKPRFRALGEFPRVTAGQARNEARALAGIAANWKKANFEGPDPFEKRRSASPDTVPTFAELVEAYIANHVREAANNPVRAEYDIRWRVKRHFAEWLARPIDQITITDVLAVKRACGARRVLANRAVEFIRTLFNWSASSRDAKVNFWRVPNPAKDISLFDEEERERFLQPDELVRFHDCLKNEPSRDLADFLRLALSTGARKSNVLAMRWADISFERQNWHIPESKNGKGYDVALTRPALDVLETRRELAADDAEFVFPSNSKSGHILDVKKSWDVFRKRAGIGDVRIHDVRRTCGSLLAIAGVSLPQIGAALGHASLQSTAIYARLQEQAVREARELGEQKMRELMESARRRLASKKALAS